MTETTIFKTNMREAFEALQLPRKTNNLVKKIERSLRSSAGVIYRKQLWYVKRHKKRQGK